MPEEVDALATFNGRDTVALLVWRHADDQHLADQTEIDVALRIDRLPFEGDSVHIRHWRIDGQHSNSYRAWQSAGAPQDPSAGQLAAIRKRQGIELYEPDRVELLHNGTLALHIRLPLPSVTLIELHAC